MLTTYNFKVVGESEEEIISEHKDYRNGIVCYNSSLDLQCYYNYLECLNMNMKYWRSYGYLDLGLMPLAMGPSFLHQILQEQLLQLTKILGVTSLLLPAASFFYDKPVWSGTDIWLYKDEVSRLTGIPESKLTTEKLLRWCMKRDVTGNV